MSFYNIVDRLSRDEINQVVGGRNIECYYWRETGDLATDGSSKSCPTSYNSAISSNNPDITLIDETQDRAFRGVTLKIPD